jgi:hypothetical protein
MRNLSLAAFVFLALILGVAQPTAATTPPKGAVLTWHDDNFRTGWQQQETVLTTSTVSSLQFSHYLVLSDQVDAQPLVIPGFINGHDIVFVVDESNWVYQIDANTGAVLTKVNLGRPIQKPPGCGNGINLGISSTPVIDWASQTLFVIAYVNTNLGVNPAAPAYFLHALDLVSLKDKVSPLKVVASHPLTAANSAAFTFNATYQKPRPALLFANNKVYAAFGSFCDFSASHSRGWLLGWSWNGTALAALPANQLADRQSSSPTSFFLSSIWMSGAGPASDELGNVIFSTGNSDGRSTSTWSDSAPCSGTATGSVPTSVPCSNIQESVVKLNGNLTQVTGLFSPNAHYGSFSPDTLTMDQYDEDLGSGGVLLVPQLGSAFFAAAAGKDGRLFLFDRSGTGLKFLQFHQETAWGCWCSPSYFIGPDGAGRIVASQGRGLRTFKIPETSLSPEGTRVVYTGQDPGFFTTVSCSGSGAFGSCTDTPIIWAVSRPLSSTSGVDLYAISGVAVNGGYPLLLGPTRVGPWPNVGANANIVPTISNGRVYVASYRLLSILSLKQATVAAQPLAAAAAPSVAAAPPAGAFAISGTLKGFNGSMLTLKNRNGKDRLIDDSKARTDGFVAPNLTPGEAYTAVGSSFTSAGALHADEIYRAKCRQHNDAGRDLSAQPACTGSQWPPDRDPGQQ